MRDPDDLEIGILDDLRVMPVGARIKFGCNILGAALLDAEDPRATWDAARLFLDSLIARVSANRKTSS